MTLEREVRVVVAPDARGARRALTALACTGEPPDVMTRVMIVPTTAAAAHLREAMERLWCIENWHPPAAWLDRLRLRDVGRRAPALVVPPCLTRDVFVHRLATDDVPHGQLADGFSRDAMMRAAMREVDHGPTAAPFPVRMGLTGDVLQFYDALRRHRRSVDDLERLVGGVLDAEADTDRGAERLLAQTRFLVAAFRAFERRMQAAHVIDEHGHLAALLDQPWTCPWSHIIVAVGDRAGDPHGLWPVDWEFLLRASGIARVDVVTTEAAFRLGLRERLDAQLPESDIVRLEAHEPMPMLLTPPGSELRSHEVRDREVELDLVASATLVEHGPSDLPIDTVIAVQRPLPYLYLAPHAFGRVGLPWTAHDDLPLGAEPLVAAFDLVLQCVASDCARADVVALLASPFLRHPTRDDGRALTAFMQLLSAEQYVADRDQLTVLLERFAQEGSHTKTGHQGVSAQRRDAFSTHALDFLSRLPDADPPQRMSLTLEALHGLLETFHAPHHSDAIAQRDARAREALHHALDGLHEACVAIDDPVVPFRDVAGTLRRWIEAHTFSPIVGQGGIRIVDAASARFAETATLWICGTIDSEWPPAPTRAVFYPQELLRELGWPASSARTDAARALFRDLLTSAGRYVGVTRPALEDEALTRPSPFLDDLDDLSLPMMQLKAANREDVPPPQSSEAAAWHAWRAERAATDDSAYRGHVGAWPQPRHAITALETYLECPFRYLCRHVLRLPEEPVDVVGLSPLESGRILHDVLERFMRDAPLGSPHVDRHTLQAHRVRFTSAVDAGLNAVSARERSYERMRLTGSAVSAGAGERVLSLEMSRDGPDMTERRVEWAFDRVVRIDDGERVRDVVLRGTVDRVDIFSDDTFAVVDYKRGNTAPSGAKALQLALYALAVSQDAETEGRRLVPSLGVYMALGPRGHDTVVFDDRRRDVFLREASARAIDAVDGIAAGDFAPSPRELTLCERCAFEAVCRQEHDGAASADEVPHD